MDTQNLIDKIVKAISHQYKTDKTVPGLQIALVKHGYYVSIVRYAKPFGKEKSVAFKARGDTLNAALLDLAMQFCRDNPFPRNPVYELNDFCGLYKICGVRQ